MPTLKTYYKEKMNLVQNGGLQNRSDICHMHTPLSLQFLNSIACLSATWDRKHTVIIYKGLDLEFLQEDFSKGTVGLQQVDLVFPEL